MQEWAPSIVAIVAVLTTAGFAKRQIRASTVTAVRMKWIESFREAVAQLLTSSCLLSTETNTQEKHEHLNELVLQIYRTSLLLDASDETHGYLQLDLDSIVGLISGRESEKAGKQAAAIWSAAQSILKAEWEKIERRR